MSSYVKESSGLTSVATHLKYFGSLSYAQRSAVSALGLDYGGQYLFVPYQEHAVNVWVNGNLGQFNCFVAQAVTSTIEFRYDGTDYSASYVSNCSIYKIDV